MSLRAGATPHRTVTTTMMQHLTALVRTTPARGRAGGRTTPARLRGGVGWDVTMAIDALALLNHGRSVDAQG
eukprot:COSAG02_NODE_4990_length_4743_cov_1.998923_2_plen_72_part_00